METTKKDLEYYRKNAEEDYMTTPISALRYISELEEAVINNKTYLSLSVEIDRQISIFNKENVKDPSVILLHPDFAKKLIEEVSDFFSLREDTKDIGLHYRGIKIIRTEDIKRGEVRVY